jgi:hypothetical protein
VSGEDNRLLLDTTPYAPGVVFALSDEHVQKIIYTSVGVSVNLAVEVQQQRKLIVAIDALHQPRVIVYRPNDDHDIICNECDKPWPCPTNLALHPEKGSL